MEDATILKDWARLIQGGFFRDYTYEARRRYAKALSWLDVPVDECILEVGCGSGRYHRILEETGFKNIVSSDITLEHIREAKKNSPGGVFVVASGERLPFHDATFGAVVSNAAIEHFANPNVGINEMFRVLRPGGVAIITSDCYVWRILQLIGLYGSRMPIDRAMTFGKFRNMYQNAGFLLQQYEAWGITHYLRRIERKIPALQRIRVASERDDSWANKRYKSALINWIRTFVMDENLFVVRKPGVLSDHCSGKSIDLKDIIACPSCGGVMGLLEDHSGFECAKCHAGYSIMDGVPMLLGQEDSILGVKSAHA